MPRFHTYGVHTFLQLYDSLSASTPTGAIVAESAPIVKWSPMQGMTHPISTTTIISPAKALPQPPIPFRIVVDFSPDIRPLNRSPPTGLDHLRGDVRIEIRIDGIVRGWRVLPQAKIWPKGVRIEFSGSRVGRTEERAFVFTPLLPDIKENNHPTQAYPLPSPNAHGPAPDTHLFSVLSDDDPTLTPHTPSDLPPKASHIQILITLGKKHDTLEKYLIFSPVLQEAFYIPPKIIGFPNEGSESTSNITRGVKRKSGTSPRVKKKEPKISAVHESSLLPSILVRQGKLKETEESANVSVSDTTKWKPVGLAGMSQKTAQMREAEFTARIHLARFWFFVVPDPAYMPFQPQASIILSSPLDVQQNIKKKDEALVEKMEVQGAVQDHLEEQIETKLEGSGASQWKGQEEMLRDMKKDGIGRFFPGSSQTEKDSEEQFSERSPRIAHGHYPDQIPTLSSEPGAARNGCFFIQPIGDLIGSADLEESRWASGSLTAEGSTNGVHHKHAQKSERTKRWSDSNQDHAGSILRSGPLMPPDCRG